jgi:ABC-2 type transport system permease protein
MSAHNVSRAVSAYAAVARSSLADALAWRADAFLGLAMGVVRVALALLLWTAVFDGRAEVGGMSLRIMASYYLIAVFIFQFNQSGPVASSFATEIRTGLFSKYLARPVDPLAWFLAASAGRSAFQAAAAIGAGLASALLGAGLASALLCLALDSSILAPLDPLGLLAAIPVVLLGMLALALINFMTGILAFVFQDISSFQVGKDCVIEFLSGALIPVALLPARLRGILSATPFPALASLPADLMLGRGFGGYPGALACLLLWDFILYIAARALYARLSPRYEEMGS